ncbi:MAG: helix-turn-helix domain-containing protein [Candidatus Aenigmatarchaeota archaeon]
MAECELCGSKAVTRTRVEGVVISVCRECAGGKEIKEQRNVFRKKVPKLPEELDQAVINNFFRIIKKKREERGLTQKELAKRILEKESVIRRIEEGWEPPFSVVKKLERFFDASFIEKVTSKKTERKSTEKLTIGDIAEVSE